MRRTRSAVIALGMLAAAALAAAQEPPLSAPQAAEALARLDARDLDGRRWTLDELRGRVVLIDFWATWCAPCLADLPRLKAVRGRHPRSAFEIVGVSLDASSRQTLTSWLNRQRVDWPQIHERRGYDGGVPGLFGIDRLPMTVLVDRDGSVDAVGLRGEALAARIDALVQRAGTEGMPPVPEGLPQ